ncbi:MAG: TonB-dependent receptor plug domain-containing protein, partial [Calditrichia bacterium]
DWGNRTGSIKWTRVFNPRLFANFWITSSRFSSDFDFGETVPVTERNFVSDLTLKGDLEYHYSRHFHTKFGFEQKNLHVEYRQTFPGGDVNIKQRPEHYVLYLQTNWLPSPRWDFEFGLRYNYFASQQNFQDWEPRFSVKYRLTETVNLRAASGVYHQYLHRIPRTFVTDIWSTSNQFQGQSRSYHFILGFQKEIAKYFQLEVEGYYKEYNNIYAFNQTLITEIQADEFDANGTPVYTQTRGLFNNGDGNSSGFEIQMRKDIGVLTGWIGYSYAKTEFRFAAVNEGNFFYPRHDRRSTVNFVGNIDLSNALRVLKGKPAHRKRGNWTLGMNFVYSSGQPITAPGSGYIIGATPNTVQRYVEYYPGQINTFRLPAYARLDLSLIYTKKFKGWDLEPYLQIYNIGNRKNVWFIEYDYSNGISEIKTVNMFPVLPTVGVNVRF